jgi:hypothetical protein
VTKRTDFIGDPRTAVHRVVEYVERHTRYLGRPPEIVVVFAEDYDALGLQFSHKPFRVVRGPSVEEYR